jgi:hypothetical protein
MDGEMERIRRLARAVFDGLKARSKEPARPTPDDTSPVLITTRDELVKEIALHFGRSLQGVQEEPKR